MKKIIRSSLYLLLTTYYLLLSVKPVHAANLSESMMRLDRMRPSQANVQILVVAKPYSTATETSLRIVFASGYTVNATPANVTVSTTGIPTTVQGESLTAWPGIGTAATAVSGQQVDIASGNLTAGTLYGFYITGGITTPASTGQYINTMTTRDGSDVDTSKIATRIIADDQVVITATVPPTFSFVLGANSTTFPTDLDASAVNSATGVTVTLGTNAPRGWVTWLRSANLALDSVAASPDEIHTVGSIDDTCTTIDTGAGHSDYYQLDVDLTTDSGVGTGNVDIATEYDCGLTSGGTFSSTFQEIATGDGTTDGDVITMIARAIPSAIRAAATDYTDTWTVVGAANF
jgi:hypothetical protein